MKEKVKGLRGWGLMEKIRGLMGVGVEGEDKGVKGRLREKIKGLREGG